MGSSKARDKHISREIHRLFWRAFMRDRTALFGTYVTRVLATAAYSTFIPLATAYALEAILARRFGDVGGYVWWIAGLSAVYCVLWAAGSVLVSKNAVSGSVYVQNEVFKNFMQKDYEFYGNAFFGSLGAQASRLRDAFNGYGELVTNSGPKQTTVVLTGIIVVAWQSPLLAMVTLLAMVFVLSYTLLSSVWRLQFRRLVSSASSEVAASIGDALSHGTTVKSFAMEDYENHRLQKPLNKWGSAIHKSWLSIIPADVGRMILAAIATAVLLILSARLYQQGSITVTMVILVQLYVIKLVAATFDIADMVKRYEDTMGMAYEPLKTMLVPRTVTDPENPDSLGEADSFKLELKTVGFRYTEAAKQNQALSDFSLTIAPGEKIGLVGYSGSGKTTLTKLLLRFMDVTSGSITLNGIDIRNLKQSELRNVISYVPQEPLLFHRDITENITYAKPQATRDEIMQAAKLAYVDEFVAELPNGYETLVGERGVKLSGGQRQRVAIARALLKDSPILVLDEATSALDSKSEQYIQEALWSLMKGRTALVIAHRLSTIQRMDRIVVMDKGHIVQIGTHEELKAQPGIYAELWQHQSGGYIGAPSVEE